MNCRPAAALEELTLDNCGVYIPPGVAAERLDGMLVVREVMDHKFEATLMSEML